jgi:hypothetical protein
MTGEKGKRGKGEKGKRGKGERGNREKSSVLVPKLQLGNAGFWPKLCLGTLEIKVKSTNILAKQELCLKIGFPSRSLGTRAGK